MRTPMCRLLVAAFVLTFSSSVFAYDFTDSGRASISIKPAPNGGEVITTVETNYHVDTYRGLLFKATESTVRYSNVDGMQGTVEIEARKASSPTDYSQVLWRGSFQGSEFSVLNDDFLAVSEFGCCGAEDTHRLINQTTGEKVEAATSRIFQIEIPNSQLKSHYLSLAIDSRAPRSVNGREYLGTVSYFDSNLILARARVYADLPAGWGASITDLKLVFASGSRNESRDFGDRLNLTTLWDKDGATNAATAFAGLALQGQAHYANRVEKFSVAVSGRKLSESGSRASSGLTLVFQ